MQPDQTGGSTTHGAGQRDELPTHQALPPLGVTECAHPALLTGSAGVVAHRRADLGQTLGRGALPSVVLFVDVSAFCALGI
jgi:hypothetical protein